MRTRPPGVVSPIRPRRRTAAALVVLALVAVGCRWVPVPGAEDCTLTPFSSVWRSDVRSLPVHARSAAYISTIGATRTLKADFGSGTWNGSPIGIPYVVVDAGQPAVPVSFLYDDESDPGPYPIPPDAPIEGGSDRHVLVVEKDSCTLYETFASVPQDGGASWSAGSGAVWDMRSNAMRPAGWTSADAAGLPILPGLVRYEEVEAGEVLHAIRMTVPVTQRTYVWPASHQAGSTSSLDAPPMGTWVRLKASVDPDDFPAQARPIVVALQTYGGIVADNGSAWYMSGAPDARWDNSQLRSLAAIDGSDFEVVDASSLRVAAGSYESTSAS